ncbi:MAG: protein arginine kinase [Candidatus Latescibacterota bacterium]|nr:protein arginine kinase [Candidatus Latescibacterota bacterium]
MTFDDLATCSASWLDGSGLRASLVISSRVRLARNLSQKPFTNRATIEDKQAIIASVVAAASASTFGDLAYFDTSALDELQRQLLVERHLISPALAKEKGPRGVLVEDTEAASVMINEEDHLRIQVIQSGLQPVEAFQTAHALERDLAGGLDFAVSKRWGFLTACATNTGTGLRASTLIHLPGLALTKEMEGVVRGVAQLGFAVRGIYGEGTDSAGNLCQISNQLTLGRFEETLLEGLNRVVGQVVECEMYARETLLREARDQIEDKVWRAFGIMQRARLLTSQELMNFSSAIRLGIDLEMLSGLETGTINDIMVNTQPSHLQYRAGKPLDAAERDILRASVVRERLGRQELN